MRILDLPFYRRNDPLAVSRELLGKVLCSRIDGEITKAVISETEAYIGPEDRASHAWKNRRTKRTEPIFAEGGIAYVYLCYGIHHMFNVVSGSANRPHANLVRAGRCLEGLEVMLERRGKQSEDKRLLGGPGSLGQALGITTDLTGISLLGDTLWIENHGLDVPDNIVTIGPRIGIDYAGEDALRPYRFVLDDDWLCRQLDGLRRVRFDPVG